MTTNWSAPTRAQLAPAQPQGREPRAERLQQRIAHVVPDRGVDVAEAVHVEQRHAAGRVRGQRREQLPQAFAIG